MANDKNTLSLHYPLTKMNFLVTLGDKENSTAAFSEVTGIEATVDVIEFRQGNANSLAPVKIPGLVKHGNITLKMGYTLGNQFKEWIMECVSEQRGTNFKRQNVTIELMDIRDGSPEQLVTTVTKDKNPTWVLSDAWVTKYVGPDLNASASEVAIESVELAYESLTIPN